MKQIWTDHMKVKKVDYLICLKICCNLSHGKYEILSLRVKAEIKAGNLIDCKTIPLGTQQTPIFA